jgi:uncharacterized protein
MQITDINSTFHNTFVVPLFSDYLVYSPLNGVSALLNQSAIRLLKDQMQLVLKGNGNNGSKLYGLANDILFHPVHDIHRKEGKLNPEFLGIIPTRSCNGACNYCDFGAEDASSVKMSYQLAAKMVDWYASVLSSQNRKIMEIHFFGGEPMMAKNVVEVVVQKARLTACEKKLIPYFEISTNGQYNSDSARFLGLYFNKVILSLDGSSEIQRCHRPLQNNKNSYEAALNTARIISHSNAELCIRCCISQLNLDAMEDFTTWLCENLRLSAINFEILCSTPQTNSAGLFPPDPLDFAVHFQKSREIARSFGIEVVYASDISDEPVVSSCPVGKDTVIVSPDGQISNCYLLPERWKKVGLDLDFGWVDQKIAFHIESGKNENIRQMVENKPRCTNCFCQWSCAGGCHVGNTWPGCSIEYDDFCKQTRLISTFSLLDELGLYSTIGNLLQSSDDLNKIVCQDNDKIQQLI